MTDPSRSRLYERLGAMVDAVEELDGLEVVVDDVTEVSDSPVGRLPADVLETLGFPVTGETRNLLFVAAELVEETEQEHDQPGEDDRFSIEVEEPGAHVDG